MKINRLEAHDRKEYFLKNQALNIFQGADDCMKKNSLSLMLQDRSPYVYLFAHPRTADDGVTKRMVWQPRLTKPQAQTNSYLFRGQSKTDIVEICWLIPPSEMWSQYSKGMVTQSEWVSWSIQQFKTNREVLERPAKDDLPDDRIADIYREIAFSIDSKNALDEFIDDTMQEI